jgi:hypothetical protein
MSQFHLHLDHWIQGLFIPKKINLAFVFQVNCPGCFIYGIPLVNELVKDQNPDLSIFGISTAFEDFEYNTSQHTELLLTEGLLVGETKKYFSRIPGHIEIVKIHFPIAFERLTHAPAFLSPSNLEILVKPYRNTASKSIHNITNQLITYYKYLPFIAETFTLNHLKGTPSFILFDEQFIIINSWFGHQSIETIRIQINSYLNNENEPRV